MRRLAIASSLLWLTTACSVLKPPSHPPTSVYVLELPASVATITAGGPIVVVTTPTAAPGYETSAMVYQRRAHELEPFAYHRWAEPPAELLAPLLVDALEATGSFAVVVRDPTRVVGDLRVDSQVTRFRQEFAADGTSLVRVALRVQIASSRAAGIVAARTFEGIEPVAESTPEAGVVATNRVVARLVGEIASWCAASSAGGAR
jgi:cholesterol transport system auxiliary component